MALPRDGSWTAKQYRDAYKATKSIANYSFRIDLRKSVGRELGKLSASQKATIRRTYNAARDAGIGQTATARVVRPRRHPRESQRAYRKRVAAIKQKAGQTGSPLTGPVLNLPKNARINFAKGEITITDQARTFEERYVPVDRIAAASDPKGYALDIAEQYAADGWSTIQAVFGVHRMQQYALFDPEDIVEYSDYIDDTGDMYDISAFWTANIVSRPL